MEIMKNLMKNLLKNTIRNKKDDGFKGSIKQKFLLKNKKIGHWEVFSTKKVSLKTSQNSQENSCAKIFAQSQ